MKSSLRRLRSWLIGDREMYPQIEADEAIRSNYGTVTVFSLVGTIFIAIMFIQSCFVSTLARHRTVYMIGTIICPIIFVLAQIFNRVWKKGILLVVYLSISLFMMYGIALGTYTDPGMQSTTFLVMMIFLPLLFIDRPLRMTAVIVFYIALFLFLAKRTKTGDVLAADTTDAVIFGLLSLTANFYLTNLKYARFILERRLRVMGITDQLTGVNNRNHFETTMAGCKHSVSRSVAVIYFDVNGLHELNNTQGHEAGDKMLCAVAEALRNQFDPRDIFRIGGDEFVVFDFNESEELINERVERFHAEVNAKNYHVSSGTEYCGSREYDIGILLKAAEKKMYAAKAAYYSTGNRERRRSRV